MTHQLAKQAVLSLAFFVLSSYLIAYLYNFIVGHYKNS
ncbi:hypothetical protein JCM19300_4298 [Algibacter lectus]|uniref:Uncharacterized protein n=1 Tax=Algibacter lectus TaxID=221126 RepID=A0A090W1E5_9FLAO|nr:hypothetical protein JCM19300_4298 [Algibacter lectus]GAL79411.1 hypothetical protein JCM19274_1919 [Algibacter lectus]